MTDSERDEALPEWLDGYVEAGRDVPPLASDAEARMLSRLLDSAAAMDAPDGGATEAGASSEAASAGAVGAATDTVVIGKLTIAGVAAVSLAVGTLLGAVSYATLSEPEVRIVERVVEVRVPSAPDPVVPVPPASADIADAAIPSATRRDASASRDGVDASQTQVAPDAGLARTRDEALADENAIITRAQSAIARGRASEALEAVHEHERAFPRGRFVEEREVLAIQALARLGRAEQATARAERFYARFPSSMLTRVVRAAVTPR